MKKLKKLILLHSNDLHGDFFSEKIEDCNVGGLSLLSGYINRTRSEENNVLYTIAGDMFRGSVIDSEYKGMSTIEIMNLLAPDVVTIGNHEVDYGIAHLLFIEKCARFPIINANLYVKTTGTRLFTPYQILTVDGMKILFIGIITEEVLAQAKQDSLVGSFIDTEEAACEIRKICNAYRSIDVDFTVLLTHIGIEADKKLAALLDPSLGVDLIIGGHSHTYMEQPITENGIVIAHAGTGSNDIGRFDITVDTERNCIDSYTWKLVPINDKTSVHDETLEKLIKKYKDITDLKYERIITRFSHILEHPQRNKETALGNLFADIFKESLGVDIMLLGSGSIRCPKLGPVVEFKNLLESFPYDDGIYMFKVSGDMLRHMVLFMLRDEAFLGSTEFYQFSKGLKVSYSRSEHALKAFTYNDKEITSDDIFTIGIQNFHYANIEDFLDIKYTELMKLQVPRIVSTSCIDILEEYLASHPMLDRSIEGRILILD